MFIAGDRVPFVVVDGTLTTDASDLGLPPGQWPNQIKVNNKVFHLKQLDTTDEGEVLCARYQVPIGTARLTVFND